MAVPPKTPAADAAGPDHVDQAEWHPVEVSSYANANEIVSEHYSLDWTIDFDAQTISGHVVHRLRALKDGVEQVVLDARELDISAVRFVEGGKLVPAKHTLHPEHFAFGQRLEIRLPGPLDKDATAELRIDYATRPECAAAGWLGPELTVGKKHPYLFTQCQPIFARALVPCMDTPSVKSTYDAAVRVPEGLVALMSAVQEGEVATEDGKAVSKWKQAIPIPSYLLALASHLDAIVQFLKIAEGLGGPYVWGRYDMLVLPTSFPYGGMENPCLTFVTPALVAGDRSLVDVVAHEIAHSWTGNLVTNFDWPSFWLNEGFTMMMERKIVGARYGKPAQQLSALLGQEDLERTVEDLGAENPFTALEADLANRNPDDAFSSIPYEKAYNFLYLIETKVGGPEAFDPYMKAHIQHFSGKSITNKDWKAFLYEWFSDPSHVGGGPETIAKLDAIDWQAWLYGVGVGPDRNEFDRTLAEQADGLAARWLAKADGKQEVSAQAFAGNDVQGMTPAQKMRFLDSLLARDEPLPAEVLEEMDALYNFTAVRNAEIRYRWLRLALKSDLRRAYPEALDFLASHGRIAYVAPVFAALRAASPEGEKLARETYGRTRGSYHPIAQDEVDEALGIGKPEAEGGEGAVAAVRAALTRFRRDCSEKGVRAALSEARRALFG
ncbi:hypothetical protein DFJ74DRAFT_600942 [Hyaloraphidium curvatum]|nr:hypothetical protein DFJ74DRAFT_600942 [Hyaloraphidium curvatum]